MAPHTRPAERGEGAAARLPVEGDLQEEAPREDARLPLFPLPAVLSPTFHSPLPESASPPAAAVERAQVVAMAERLMHSVHVGRIAGGHQVNLRLHGDVEVRLRHQDGVLQATVIGEGDQGALARRLGAELRARGIRFDRVELG